jgi:hypothetical protein
MIVRKTLLFLSFFLCLLFLPPNLQAQKKQESFKLKGAVADLNTGKPLSGVTVLVTSRQDNKELTGTTTNEKGFYTINNIPESPVRAKFSMVGYQTQIVDSISLEENSVMGVIKLKPTAVVLPEIVIKSLKPVVEYKLDRKVVNMDMVPGGSSSVTDALKNSGAVDVDPATNKISVRGQDVKLQIDGRPFELPADALTQMPASMLDQVEVILSPGAKESAEGGAYIVNLISKKNTLDNYNGSVSLSTSTNNRNFGGVNLNYKVNKFNFFGSFFGGFGKGEYTSQTERTNYYSKNLHFQNSSGNFNYDGYMGTGKLGLDYNLDDNNLFTFYTTFQRQKATTDNYNDTRIDNDQQITQYYYKNSTNSDFTYDNLSFYGYYKKKFAAKGHEIIFDALFSKLDNPNSNNMNVAYNYKPSSPTLQNSGTDVSANTFIFKTDYTYPFSNGRLEAGYNFTTRFRENNYNVFDYSYLKNSWLDSMNLGNRFRYTENIHAIYATYYQKINRFEIKAGLRMENLDTHGEQFTTNQDFKENYFNLFPDISIGYKLFEGQNITFAAFRRVKYPQLYFVNPFRVYNGPNEFQEGNPKLRPYFINAYSLTCTQFLNFYYVFSTGMFQTASTSLQDSISTNSYINLGTNKTYGIEVTLPYYNSPAMPFHLPDFITMINIRFEYMWRRQEGTYYTEDLSYLIKRPTLNASLGLKLWYDVNASTSLYYTPSTETRRENNGEMKYLSLSLSKSILDQKLRISLSFSDILNSQKYDDETFGANYYSKSSSRVKNSRGVSISFSYMFNDYKERRDRNIDDGRDASGKSGF